MQNSLQMGELAAAVRQVERESKCSMRPGEWVRMARAYGVVIEVDQRWGAR